MVGLLAIWLPILLIILLVLMIVYALGRIGFKNFKVKLKGLPAKRRSTQMISDPIISARLNLFFTLVRSRSLADIEAGAGGHGIETLQNILRACDDRDEDAFIEELNRFLGLYGAAFKAIEVHPARLEPEVLNTVRDVIGPILRELEPVEAPAEPPEPTLPSVVQRLFSTVTDILDNLRGRTQRPALQTITTLHRFTDIRFPEQCKIYRPVYLSIQLTLRPVQNEVDIPADVPKPRPAEELKFKPTIREAREERVELIVVVSADHFEIDQRWRKLSVPFDGDSEKIAFELIGQELGPQVVEVEFFHGATRIGYVVIESHVLDGPTSGQDAQVTYEKIDDPVLFIVPAQPSVTVVAHWQEDRGLDYWIIEKDHLPDDGGFVSMASSKEAVDSFWKDMSSILEGSVQLAGLSESELRSIWLNIQCLGQELYEELLSSELRNHSAQWPTGSIVSVATNEKWIPWELIHDGDDFWGSKFVLARVPKIPDRDAFLTSDEAVERYASPHLHKIVNIIGGGLRLSVIEDIKSLFAESEAGILAEVVEKGTLDEVLQAMADADLVHFTCHGHAEPHHCMQLADEHPSPISCLTPINIRNFPKITDSIVFANACKSTIPTSFLGELRSFGWEFYKKGAAAYIGTLGLVPTDCAVVFAKRFYEKLLAGYTVGESLHYARLTARQENPFWLLYTLVGDPYARKSIQH
jgi:hypothetical protein